MRNRLAFFCIVDNDAYTVPLFHYTPCTYNAKAQLEVFKLAPELLHNFEYSTYCKAMRDKSKESKNQSANQHVTMDFTIEPADAKFRCMELTISNVSSPKGESIWRHLSKFLPEFITHDYVCV